ncbi:MAG: hypothetical protein OER90_02630 [Gemmatimonadota bacterium]|nr:hypothetical protein [Gemmatimonadota bacterium]
MSIPLAAANAQDAGASQAQGSFVFLDCHTRLCDFSHFRREITFVNWVRDRQDADVHLLVTQQGTAGGGSRITLTLFGLRELQGRSDTLHVVTAADDSYEEERAALTRALALSLIPYVWHSDVFQRLSLDYTPAVDRPGGGVTENIRDPWNYWVFRTGVGGSVESESQERFLSGDIRMDASRITEDLKLELEIDVEGNRSEFDFVDEAEGIDTTYVSVRTFYGFEGLAAWSIGRHWSAGGLADVSRSSTRNTDLRMEAGPAIEYNIFPYEESTWRRFTLRYAVGVAAFNWADTTIFDRTSEVHPVHVFEIEIGVQQPWGTIRGSLDAFQYLHDLSKHSISVGGHIGVRVVRGLEFQIGGNFSRIKDQIYLSKEGLTSDEVLLQQRERGTDYRLGLDLGLSFRFGSKFANVVNPRF